jgi:NAD(P)-dependent dehydrogenase (short-subunit alcohol dehydrogenase family)
MAEEVTKQHHIAVIALAPGWMRTERVLAAFNATAADWQKHPELGSTETPLYLGRAVAALAADPSGALEMSGKVVRVADLAVKYGFKDEDGRQPAPFHYD